MVGDHLAPIASGMVLGVKRLGPGQTNLMLECGEHCSSWGMTEKGPAAAAHTMIEQQV
jgi:hypothetical protein